MARRRREKTFDSLTAQYERLDRQNHRRLLKADGTRRKKAPYAAVQSRSVRLRTAYMNSLKALGQRQRAVAKGLGNANG